MSQAPAQIMIVAAEASSALYAQRLLEHWRFIGKEIKSFGVGTQAMEDLGFERLGKSEEMAVVGIAEVIEHYSELKAVFERLVKAAVERRPQVILVLDYPDFNLKLAKELSAKGLRVVYYVSPQVWAWRKGRVNLIKKYCDKVLLLFPFEQEFYREKQVPYEFVGHPVLDDLSDSLFDESRRLLQRRRRGVQDDECLVGLMPGSRKSEIKLHLPLQIEVARRLCRDNSKVKILFLVAPTLSKEQIQDYLDNVQFPYLLIKDDPLEMIFLTDVILAASGTATLMVGLLQKPMVVMYKLKWLTGMIAKLVVHGVKFFGIVNLIFNREVVPERWQGGANPAELTRLMNRYIQDPQHATKVKAELAKLAAALGEKGATKRVAASLEKYFETEMSSS
jgi:lipid-A-disaccharide synthase